MDVTLGASPPLNLNLTPPTAPLSLPTRPKINEPLQKVNASHPTPQIKRALQVQIIHTDTYREGEEEDERNIVQKKCDL